MIFHSHVTRTLPEGKVLFHFFHGFCHHMFAEQVAQLRPNLIVASSLVAVLQSTQVRLVTA